MSDEERRVARWIERAVIGLNFCPFAKPVWNEGRVRISISDAGDLDAAVQATLNEVTRVLDTPELVLSTSLVVFPKALADFDEFLEAAARVEDTLAVAGASGVLQIATFHPAYQFQGAGEEALSNWTNRAPYPILHILREAEVTRAVDEHPDAEMIPQSNIERIERMGRARIQALWQEIESGEASDSLDKTGKN